MSLDIVKMGKIVFGWILKAPIILLMIVSIIASFVAVANGVAGVRMYVPISCAVIFVLYIIGEILHRDRGRE